MERECCLSVLIALLGGTALLACGWWPAGDVRASNARRLERITWRRIWLPVALALVVAATLCGWALAEPDPVPERVPASLVAMSLPFAMLLARAAVRSVWALIANVPDPGIGTVGLLRPSIVFSPHLAKTLSDRQIEAALEHERAHSRHRDPLRIWLAQLVTDLQWPWPQARERLHRWLAALELARDEEARTAGIDGTDLAEVILASARFGQTMSLGAQTALTGRPAALKQRIARLLGPSPAGSEEAQASVHGPLFALLPILMLALALGSIFGERVVHALFWVAG